MRFDVYCDESYPDLFTAKEKMHARYLMIGSLWLPTDMREALKEQISGARQKHSIWGEVKWTKTSPSSIPFLHEIIDIFISHGDNLRFRCIAVRADQINHDFNDGDKELGFYKFYYQLLHHWVSEFNEYK